MDVLHVAPGVDIPLAEVELRFSRASGPGGQNVNKRDTRVEAWFDIAATQALGPVRKARALERLAPKLDRDGRLRIVASEERSQARNRELALDRLAATLAQAIAPPPRPRRPTKPSRKSIERAKQSKGRRSEIKQQRRRIDP